MTIQLKDLTKFIGFSPAYDKRSSEPSKNYGIHGVDMLWTLGDPKKGVISWLVYTHWYLPEVQKELESKPVDPRFPYLHFLPQPVSLEYHSILPQYEGQNSVKNCSLLEGKDCYCDGSDLAAKELFELFVREGPEPVWNKMFETWLYRFENNQFSI